MEIYLHALSCQIFKMKTFYLAFWIFFKPVKCFVTSASLVSLLSYKCWETSIRYIPADRTKTLDSDGLKMGFHWQRDDSRDCLPAERICLLPDKGNWSVGYSCSAVVSVAVTCKEEWSLNIKKSKIKTEPHWSHCLCFSFCIHGTSIFLKNCTFSTPPPTSHCDRPVAPAATISLEFLQ